MKQREVVKQYIAMMDRLDELWEKDKGKSKEADELRSRMEATYPQLTNEETRSLPWRS